MPQVKIGKASNEENSKQTTSDQLWKSLAKKWARVPNDLQVTKQAEGMKQHLPGQGGRAGKEG